MLEVLNPARRGHAGPLVNVTAANHFWHLLPRHDPVAAQRALSDALSDLARRTHLNVDQVRALLGIDQLARSLADALLVDYSIGRSDAQPHDSDAWQAAFELSQSFAQAFEHALRYLREENPPRVPPEYLSTVLLRLFQHRQVEFLLRPFVSERSLPDCWVALHTAYIHAEIAGLLAQPLVSRRSDEARGDESTLEREFIHVLLMELLNVGQLSPYDAFWLSRQIPRWRAVLSLRGERVHTPGEPLEHCFVVDLGNAEGLVRPARSTTGTRLYLDLAPMLALLRDEIAALRDPAGPLDHSAPISRGRQLKLLRKVHAICQPRLERIDRRGDRLPTVSTVKAIVGLPHITRMLRHEKRRTSDSAHGPAAASGEYGVPHQEWQLKDRSASGCRLRGKIANPNRVLPGTLIAFRERDSLAWTLVIVRRLRKRIGDRVDIGVEHVGQNPSGVSLVAQSDPAGVPNAEPDEKRDRCTGLYLRASSEYPKIPFNTLILWPREYKVGRCLVLRSDEANYTVRLKEPIEEQDGFIWLPYEIVDRRAGGTDMLQEVA